MRIGELLDDIRNRDLVLPEFQREYVWSRDQAKQLMDSLFKGYPVGGLLLWKTDNPPELKNVSELPDRIGTVQVLLDGQQRLTTLHMLLRGDIPAYYTEADIQSDPRDLYFNLQSGEFQYFQASRMRGDPLWRSVVDCFRGRELNVIKIAMQSECDEEAKLTLAEVLNENLNRLKAIVDIDLPAQIVPHHANLDVAIDIFDRVNSQGTKLTEAELALTHVTGKWPQARRVLKQKMETSATKNFHFGLNFMTRALTSTVMGRALFETIHNEQRPALEEGWSKLDRVIDYLMNILPQQAFIHSTEDLSTTNALIPWVAFLSRNGGRFSNQRSIHHAMNWLYSALIWARYTAQTDQRLEADLSIIAKELEPWDQLRAQIVDQRGRVEVKASDFEGRTAQHPLYRMTYILLKVHGAVDWFNGIRLGQTHGDAYALHSHHIFPQALLYRQSEWDADNYLHRQVVNEIANRAYLTVASNIALSDTQPADYLPSIEEQYPGALTAQFIPMDPALWRVERYADFLSARRELIANKLNEFMSALISEPEEVHHRPIADLVQLGESSVLEFKSTLQWDVMQNKQNKELCKQCTKTIAAFMNTEGGTLVIGVEDDGKIFGLEQDLKLVGGSRDRFEQQLSSLIADQIGLQLNHYWRTRFEVSEGKQVCVVEVDPVHDGVFLRAGHRSEFFIRVGNTTRSLDPEQTKDYLDGRRE